MTTATATTNRPTIKDVKSISIETRHWTDSFGNTYWTGELYLNGEEVHAESFEYGYGSQSKHVIIENAVKLGKLPRSKDKEVVWKYLNRVVGPKNWEHTDLEVSRKRDL